MLHWKCTCQITDSHFSGISPIGGFFTLKFVNNFNQLLKNPTKCKVAILTSFLDTQYASGISLHLCWYNCVHNVIDSDHTKLAESSSLHHKLRLAIFESRYLLLDMSVWLKSSRKASTLPSFPPVPIFWDPCCPPRPSEYPHKHKPPWPPPILSHFFFQLGHLCPAVKEPPLQRWCKSGGPEMLP